MASDKAKAEYVKIINKLWSGTMQCNNVAYIDDEVIRLMDIVLTQIRDGSKAMVGIHAVYSIFYMQNYGSWAELLEGVANAGAENGADWIAVLMGSKQYKIVVQSVALGYKSPVQIALYDAAM